MRRDSFRQRCGPRPGSIAPAVTGHRRSPGTSWRSGHRPRLRHDGSVGGTAGVRPRGLASRRHAGRVRGDRGTQPRAAAGRRRLHRRRESADLGPDRVAGTVRSRPASGGAERLAHGAAGAVGTMVTQLAARPVRTSSAPDARPTVRRRSTSARTSSSTSTTTLWKTSAVSIWSSTSSAATSRSGPQP